MMKNIITLWIIAIGCYYSTFAQTWYDKGEKNGVKGAYSVQNGEYCMRLSTTVEASLGGCVGLLKDANAYPKWMEGTTSAKLLKTPNPFEIYYYGTSDQPWPIMDRDFAMHGIFSQNPSTKFIEVNLRAVPSYYPIQKDYERIQYYKANMTLNPIKKGITIVQFEVFMNTKEGFPEWLIDWYISDKLFNSIFKFAQLAETDIYRNVVCPNIIEPK